MPLYFVSYVFWLMKAVSEKVTVDIVVIGFTVYNNFKSLIHLAMLFHQDLILKLNRLYRPQVLLTFVK